MKEILDFLNTQSGDRLAGYALLLLLLTFILVNGMMSIVSSIASIFKNKQNKIIDKDKK